MANESDQMTVDEAIAFVRKCTDYGCGSDSAVVLADEVERLRRELDTVGEAACRFKLALQNLCMAAPEAIRDAPSTRTVEFERFLDEADRVLRVV